MISFIHEIQERNRGIFEAVNKRLYGDGIKLDLIFIPNRDPDGEGNFYLVTGANEKNLVYAAAVVFPDGSSKLAIKEMEKNEAEDLGLEYVPYKNRISEALFGKSGVLGEKRKIGFSGELPSGMYLLLKENGHELIDISGEIESARIQKTKQELDYIRKACDITCEVASQIPNYVEPGMKEFELAALLGYEMGRRGGIDLAFPTIVAFGENSADIHHTPGGRELKKGDFILADFGCKYKRLFSDLTVDFVFGEASDPQKDLYYGVLEVQKGALKNLKVGVDGYQLCSQAKQRIKDICSQKNIEGEMLHRLGHGGGFYIHDGPSIDDSLNFIIPDGLVTTIEPGCYVPGWGGVRIEDVVYVTKGGLEIFTFKAPKDRLIEIPV